MQVLSGLEPQAVFDWFERLCAIPHGSGDTGRLAAFLADFAAARGLRRREDEAGNVVIWKDAYPGYEDHPAVILQGHLDMVCEKAPGCDLDFRTDGLRLRVEGDRVFAEGTTLGGDDGVAVACALALLDADDIPHPPLEVLLTADEEIGLLGASALDASDLRGRILLNLDSESEGCLTVGCAGGVTCDLTLPCAAEPAAGRACRVTVTGLAGGHSGIEIHKGRANANKLLAELLALLAEAAPLRLSALRGGNKDNAIPRTASAELVISPAHEDRIRALTVAFAEELRARWSETEPELQLEFRTLGAAEAAWSAEDTRRVIALLNQLPNGIQSMSRQMEGLVETSLNLGVLQSDAQSVVMTLSVRSSLERDKRYLAAVLEGMARDCGADFRQRGDYAAWEYREDSPLRELMVRTYEELYGRVPQVEVIHAGLECGVLSRKLPDLDCVSFGPDIHGIHTTEEYLSVVSMARTWRYLLTVLERL